MKILMSLMHPDHIFDQTCANATIYQHLIKDIISAAVDGFNGIVPHQHLHFLIYFEEKRDFGDDPSNCWP